MTPLRSMRRGSGLLIGLLIAAAFLPRVLLAWVNPLYFFFEEEVMSQAVFGLMAKHILEGHPMVYMYGQGYMGSVESILQAFYFVWTGMSPFSQQLATVTFYSGFVAANFVLVKRTLGLSAALPASLWLVLPPYFLTQISLSSWAGYNETLFFGSAFLCLFLKAIDDKSRRGRWFFAAGLAAGIGFWAHNLILMYFFPLLAVLFMSSAFWGRVRKRYSLLEILLLKGLKMPAIVRVPALAVNAFVLGFIFWNTVSVITGYTEIQILGFKLATYEAPFRVKEIKKILLVLVVQIGCLFLWRYGRKLFANTLKRVWPLAGGFLLGESPVIYYSLFDDSGYRQIHASGMIEAQALPGVLQKVLVNGLSKGLLGFSFEGLFWTAGAGLIAACAAVIMGLAVTGFVFSHRNEIYDFMLARHRKYSPGFFILLMSVMTVLICVFNNVGSTNKRYLVPLYFTLAIMTGWGIGKLGTRNRWLAAGAGILLLTHNALTHQAMIGSFHDKTRSTALSYERILNELNERGIRWAYAHCDIGYPLSFLSRETITFAAYQSINRMPWYNAEADKQARVAYVLSGADSGRAFKEILDTQALSYEWTGFDEWNIFIIDRTYKSEKPFVDG